MSLFVCSLNSGSNANCYYVGNQEEAILVDGGLSCRETEKRIRRAGLSLKRVKAIFVSHEHGDHVHGVPGLSRKHRLPVYITPETLRSGRLEIGEDLVLGFRPHEPVRIGNLLVTAFPKFHDATDPHSFVVECSAVRVGVFTDIGQPCEQVISHFRQCHAAFLEANYDNLMLARGRYPVSLKNRIRGGRGHLSNEQALDLFARHRPPFMSHLFLSHLSRENNSPTLVKNTFSRIAGRTRIVIASRERETEVYHIRQSSRAFSAGHGLQPTSTAQQQLSLF